MRAAFLGALFLSAAMHAVLLLLPIHPGFPRGDPGDVAKMDIEPWELALPPEPLAVVPPSTPAARPPREPVPEPERREPSVQPPSSPAPVRLISAVTAMPHFTIAIGTVPDAHGSVSTGSSVVPASDVTNVAPIADAIVDSKARLLEGRAPTYPDDARASGVEGDVRLELVVGLEGVVENARVIQSANASLDKAALAAARSYRFDPAKKSGHRVRVRMAWTIEFRLQ